MPIIWISKEKKKENNIFLLDFYLVLLLTKFKKKPLRFQEKREKISILSHDIMILLNASTKSAQFK